MPAQAIVARVHAMAVEVVASGDGKTVNVASGVMAGGGIVFTDLRAVSAKSSDGAPIPPDQIAVLTAAGVFVARIAGVAPGLDVAVLELPQAARGIEGPPLGEGSLAAGDRLLAIRASNQGTALRFEAMRFSVEGWVENRLSMRSPDNGFTIKRCAVAGCSSAATFGICCAA